MPGGSRRLYPSEQAISDCYLPRLTPGTRSSVSPLRLDRPDSARHAPTRRLILLSQVLELLALCGVARETPQSEPSTEFQPSDVFCLVDIGLGRASGG
jgi:hypothetical protein